MPLPHCNATVFSTASSSLSAIFISFILTFVFAAVCRKASYTFGRTGLFRFRACGVHSVDTDAHSATADDGGITVLINDWCVLALLAETKREACMCMFIVFEYVM